MLIGFLLKSPASIIIYSTKISQLFYSCHTNFALYMIFRKLFQFFFQISSNFTEHSFNFHSKKMIRIIRATAYFPISQ